MFIYKLTQAFDKKNVDYAIVGGFAVALHGAVRGTLDIDLIIKLTKSSFLKAEEVLESLGLVPRLPVKADQVFDYREEYIKNKNLIAWSFCNPKNSSEVVDIIITHDLSKIKTTSIKSAGHTLTLLSIDELIKMKKTSGRPQDLEDIKALQELRK
jgi:hypothetical protein